MRLFEEWGGEGDGRRLRWRDHGSLWRVAAVVVAWRVERLRMRRSRRWTRAWEAKEDRVDFVVGGGFCFSSFLVVAR